MLCCAAQEDSYFAGRVVCETEGGQLNDTAVMLEGNTNLSGGARVHLNLSLLSAYRLFPGQVGGIHTCDAVSASSLCLLHCRLLLEWLSVQVTISGSIWPLLQWQAKHATQHAAWL